jgi:hypothetical protein
MGPEFLHVDGRTELICALRNSAITPIEVGKWVLRSSKLLCSVGSCLPTFRDSLTMPSSLLDPLK